MGEFNPFGYHLANAIGHGIVSSLVFVTAFCLFKDINFKSIVTGVLYASHPIHTDAVASVVGRAEILCAIFFCLSLISYINCVSFIDIKDSQDANSKTIKEKTNWILFYLSIFFALLSIFSKENGITVLGIFGIYDAIFIHPFNFKWFTKKYWNKKTGFFVRHTISVGTILFLLALRKKYVFRWTPNVNI